MPIKIILAAAIAALVAGGADAQDAPKLTVRDVINVTSGLGGLDAHQTGIVDNNGNAVTAPNSFHFASGTVLMTIAQDISVGRGVLQSYQSALNALRIELAGAPGKDVPKDKSDDFNKRSTEMLDAPANVILGRISAVDLCLSKNPPACPEANNIPVNTLSLLVPIIDK